MTTAVLPRHATVSSGLTVADLAARFGSLPAWRIHTDIAPGTATEEDVLRLREAGVYCELVDGILVEKAVSGYTSFLAIEIAGFLREFAKPRKLGWVLGPDGFVWLAGDRLRAPDVSFVRREQIPGGRYPQSPAYLRLSPALAVEVFSPGNTLQEMDEKRAEYFAAGSELVWIVFPETQTVEVTTGPGAVKTLGREDVLTGEPVLPGFVVKVAEIFDAVDLGDAPVAPSRA